MKDKIRKKPKIYIWIPIAAVLIAIAIIMDCVVYSYWYVIAAAFSDTESVMNTELMEEAVEESLAINAEILEEGAVLLKNDGALPIASDKVNAYGLLSASTYPNGSGSGSASSTNERFIKLDEALASVDITVQPDLWSLISSAKVEGTTGDVDEGSIITSTTAELSVSTYNSTLSWSAAKDYSEYAIVTFGRLGAEGSDMGRNTLELNDNELALLQKLHEEGFKVITLVNSSHVMELGSVEQYSDAVLWIGGPGLAGMNGVARILAGEVSPSGRLVDTWMYQHETSSTYYTAQTYNYTGSASGGFTNFNEGIYIGYRWYETADAEGYWDTSVYNGYDNVVVYPFGYGLSYTTFSEEMTATYEDGIFTFEVTVENTGDVDGKDVIEIYAEKPYTNGQSVEVSKVELVAFAKTDTLSADNSSQTLTLTVNAEDLASYDETAADGIGAYVLAGGTYKFYLASGDTGAHCWKSVSAEVEENGASSRYFSQELSRIVYSGENGRESDAVAAQNQLGENEYNPLAIDDDNAGYTALSRKDGFANAKTTIFTQQQNVTLTDSDAMSTQLSSAERTKTVTYPVEMWDNLDTAQKKVYTLEDMYTYDSDGNALYEYDFDLNIKTVLGTVSYDDERWDYLISQMSVDEMDTLIGYGGWRTAAVASIDKAYVQDFDGPYGLNNYMQSVMGIQTSCTSFMSEPVSASTWNVELIERLGEAIGKEANASGQSGWYAPGANIHRTSFGGRNAEYFSEDPYISGVMCGVEAQGAMNWGLYCYAKHFAFNDIEANRTSMENCWMSEQTAREIYLKPFELGIKSGGVTALMSSYMWINGIWGGGSYSLLTKIVRDEWGFNGIITTDNGTSLDWVTPSKVIYAGGDMVLVSQRKKIDNSVKNSDEGLSAMKTATKHILYTISSAYLNRQEATKVGANRFVPIFVALNVVLYGAALACIAVYITKLALYKKKKN